MEQRMIKNIFSITFLLVLCLFNLNNSAFADSSTLINPLVLVNNPQKYLNANVRMNVVFDKFSALGLDYKPVNRSSDNYIGFLVQRGDTVDHNIPLSELKLFLKKEYAEKFIELDTGDKLSISGKVFSTALGDAWVDIDKIVIKEKVKKDTDGKK